VLEVPGKTRKSGQAFLTHTGLHTTHPKWLVLSWSTFGAGTATGNTDTQDSPQPGLGGSHHLPPYSILCATFRGLHPNGSFSWDSRDSRPGVPKSHPGGSRDFGAP